MEVNQILTYVMLLAAVVFLVLFFVLPGEIHLGAAVASLIIAAIFHRLHRRTTALR